MKNVFLATIIFLFTGQIFAQKDNTLFNGHTRNGFFVSPIFEYSDLKGDLSTSAGLGLGFVAGDLFIGGYGLGLTDYDKALDEGFDKITLGHGGLWVGYTYPQTQVMHLFSSVKLGWGGANFEIIDDELEYDDSFFVFTPEVGLEFNVFRWFRIAATGGYRFLNGMDEVNNFTEKDFEGWTGTLTLRIGGFGREYGGDYHHHHWW